MQIRIQCFVLNRYIIDYELSIIDGGLLRGIRVQHHKEMSRRRAGPSRTIRLSLTVCAAHPASLLIATHRLLMLMIVRGKRENMKEPSADYFITVVLMA